jgi:hypothetical protein
MSSVLVDRGKQLGLITSALIRTSSRHLGASPGRASFMR